MTTHDTAAPPAPSRALRLLAAADRVREAAQECDRADRACAEAWAIHEDTRDVHGQLPLHTPEAASYQRAAVSLLAVWKELTAAREALDAATREPGDSAWALGVLGAAGEYDVAERAFEQVTARRAANKSIREELEHVRALDSRNAAYEALLAAARGAR